MKKVGKTRFYWKDRINNWKLFGVWFVEKYFIGFAIVVKEKKDGSARL